MSSLLAAIVISAAVAEGEMERQFVLSIDNRTITEPEYRAVTSVHISGRGVHVEAGAVVEARAITVKLRDVHGTVTFRGSLERLRQLIEKFEREKGERR